MSSAFQKSLQTLERMAKGQSLHKRVNRGGDPYKLWQQACDIFTSKFIETGKHYGAPFYAHMRTNQYHELSYAMRSQGFQVPASDDSAGIFEYRLPCDTSLRLIGQDHVLPVPGYPELPDNAVAVSDPTGYGLICVFDFGFCISDVCVHESAEAIQGYLTHKGLRTHQEQDSQLGKLFVQRAKDADWNF